MKCTMCGTQLSKGVIQCPKCGTVNEDNAAPEVYTGKTKSKTVAGILMLFGIGDLYLLDIRKFFIRMAVLCCTCGIGAVWQIIDAIRIFNGSIDCDANGTPLV